MAWISFCLSLLVLILIPRAADVWFSLILGISAAIISSYYFSLFTLSSFFWNLGKIYSLFSLPTLAISFIFSYYSTLEFWYLLKISSSVHLSFHQRVSLMLYPLIKILYFKILVSKALVKKLKLLVYFHIVCCWLALFLIKSCITLSILYITVINFISDYFNT